MVNADRWMVYTLAFYAWDPSLVLGTAMKFIDYFEIYSVLHDWDSYVFTYTDQNVNEWSKY